MPTYRNGYIPTELLISVGWGYDEYGRYEWLLSPATAAKHRALIERSPGKALSPSPGWSCYRPYAWQVKYRSVHGIWAAWPGTSSHGGVWEGRQTLAIDYHNWSKVYGGDRERFYADVRAVGLEPGLISEERGYPDEPWHVICLDPWGPIPSFEEAKSLPLPDPVAPDEDEDDMDKAKIIWTNHPDGKPVWALVGASVPTGRRTTRQQATANRWAYVYGPAVKVDTYDEFNAVHGEFAILNAAWVAQQKTING